MSVIEHDLLHPLHALCPGQADARRPIQARRRGRKLAVAVANEAVVEKIREMLRDVEALGFRGEGYRKV